MLATPEVVQRTLHESRELSEPRSNGSLEFARRTDETEEAGRVHLDRGVTGQIRKLLGVFLWSCDDKAQPVFRTVRRRVCHRIDELSDKLARRLVAPHEIRRTPNREGEHQ